MKEKIKTLINQLLDEKNITLDQEFTVEIPKSSDHGDFSTNVAMLLAKILQKSPLDIANDLTNDLNEDFIKKIEIKSPGFINFFLEKEYLFENLNKVLEEQENYGKSNIGNNLKINVEFVSANPTGLIHVGTSRNAAYGDSICRILSFAGYDVTREYYFNDGGVQIEKLGESLKARYYEICDQNIEFPQDGYHGKEVIDIANSLYQKEQSTKLNAQNNYFATYAKDYLIELIKKDLNDFRVTFDVWTSEQDIRNSGKIEESLELLRNYGVAYEKEGATWLNTTKYGDDKDRVIIKSDGNYTYLVPDIAYHLDKIKRGFNEIIDVLGADHHGYISRLKASVEALGFNSEKIHIKMIQMVRLLQDGEEIKMSKRTGLTVTMRELMEEIGVNAARYFFAQRSIDTQMDFDLDLAKKNSNENPVYYISYANARICTILEKQEYENNEKINKYVTLNSDEAYNVLTMICNFKSIVEQAATKKTPHIIANYTYDLASSFHSYYEKHKIITDDILTTNENINLIKAVKITLNNALNLIGVMPPEKM